MSRHLARWLRSSTPTPRSSAQGCVPLSRRRLVGDLECAIDDGERLAELLFGDAKRGIREEIVPVDECVDPLIAQVGAETLHLGAGAVEGSHRLLRPATAPHLEDAEQSDPSG